VTEVPKQFKYRKRRPMQAVRSFLSLPRADKLAALEALAIVVAVRGLVIVAPDAKLGGAISRMLSNHRIPSASRDELTRDSIKCVRAAVQRASARVPGATCLVQAISGWCMLKMRSIDAQIRIGVEKCEDEVCAHAWLVVGDIIVLGGSDASARYSILEAR
jgi:hypothetical protein